MTSLANWSQDKTKLKLDQPSKLVTIKTGLANQFLLFYYCY
jgi:hypothetical protein